MVSVGIRTSGFRSTTYGPAASSILAPAESQKALPVDLDYAENSGKATNTSTPRPNRTKSIIHRPCSATSVSNPTVPSDPDPAFFGRTADRLEKPIDSQSFPPNRPGFQTNTMERFANCRSLGIRFPSTRFSAKRILDTPTFEKRSFRLPVSLTDYGTRHFPTQLVSGVPVTDR